MSTVHSTQQMKCQIRRNQGSRVTITKLKTVQAAITCTVVMAKTVYFWNAITTASLRVNKTYRGDNSIAYY